MISINPINNFSIARLQLEIRPAAAAIILSGLILIKQAILIIQNVSKQ